MFAVIYIPDFALQSILRHEPELFSRPVALIDGDDKKATVLQLTESARKAGVTEGLTSTQALARCGDVLIKSRSPAHERSTADVLLQTAYTFSPRIEATSDGICTLDLQGLKIQAAGTDSPADAIPAMDWGQKIVTLLAQLHLRVRVGIASTPNLAWHAAHTANPVQCVQQSREFISSLPVESLEPLPPILDILRRWGIKTVGEFIALGKDRIAERLGPEALEMFDRASMTEIRPLNLVAPAEQFSESMDLEHEIESLPPLLFILRRFVEQLAKRIDLLHLVVSELELHLKLASGDQHDSFFRVPSPTANVQVLFSMLQTHLETVRTESPIVALELSARAARSENFQFGLFETSLRDPNQFAETLARLSALCGNAKVGSPGLQNTFRPDAFKMESPNFEASPGALREKLPQPLEPEVTASLCLRRFRPPFHADVELREGRPAFVASLKFNSPIRKLAGPFRSSGEWWEQEHTWQRDEWDIQVADGSLYRIYHAKEDWFIEGIYD